MTMFTDRTDAGRRLAQRMKPHRGEDVVVLGLPRGGVVVAYEVAHALGAPLDVIVVRKLGVPYQPEVAMGAIGEDGVRVIDHDIVAHAGVTDRELETIERRERTLLDTRVQHYRKDHPRLDLTGRVALIVDDGMATGATARAACQVARGLGAAQVVLAVPVASCGAIRTMTDMLAWPLGKLMPGTRMSARAPSGRRRPYNDLKALTRMDPEITELATRSAVTRCETIIR